MKGFFAFAGIIIGVLVLVVGLSIFQFGMYKTFAPLYEGVRRDVMLESRAYSEATTREMYNLQRQYLQAKTEPEKNAIRAMAIHEASSFDKRRLPPDLQLFLNQIGG